MKIVRVLYQGIPTFGILKKDQVEILQGDPFEKIQIKETIPFREQDLLPPVIPSKIIGVGLNYTDHIHEMKMVPPQGPLIFLKAPSALNGPNQPIVLPKMSQQVEYEGELAVIIGKKCKDIKAAEVEKYTKSHPSSFKLGSILCDRFFLVFSKVNLFVENGFQLKSCWNDS